MSERTYLDILFRCFVSIGFICIAQRLQQKIQTKLILNGLHTESTMCCYLKIKTNF